MKVKEINLDLEAMTTLSADSLEELEKEIKGISKKSVIQIIPLFKESEDNYLTLLIFYEWMGGLNIFSLK